ncbi:hypothetical protein BJ085DRAFT_23803 [Dimargaris cristalligena]|uniref:SET domain-containing protein n=1 Tax=Dimargaris cristalligena TaxID=215637 RepID=A0A4P9ZM33_9FUNG|nr:hypothetical protein BJ085DRAFT_23803 [Dimargaris cristalligena]|eukprot:RKP34357.1 hypothetical protein BJ085DRAFT_23803 [Dimargaris cristalligena]
MKSSTLSTVIALGTLGAAGLAYVVYFDYKRRNDPTFRRKLKREKKKALKDQEEKDSMSQSQLVVSIERALTKALEEPFPADPTMKEKMFMECVAEGEKFVAMGETGFENAAIVFYRALKVYPDPVELIMIYQKTVPQSVLSIIMGMLGQDVKRRQDTYYDNFPPKSMNVTIKSLPEGAEKTDPKYHKGAVAAKDFAIGDIIYTEDPEVSLLMPSLQDAPYCSFCLKYLLDDTEAPTCDSCKKVRYCSTQCKDKAYDEFHRYLCPGNYADPHSKAQELFNLWSDKSELSTLMIARFFGHLIEVEKSRQLTAGEGDFTVWERMEHLKFLELPDSAMDHSRQNLINELICKKVPGLDEFMTDERYLSFKGKLLYNAIAIRSDDPEAPSGTSTEYVRSPSNRGVKGSGLYLVSSYVTHSCQPNTVPVFPKGTHKLALKATRPIKAGEELSMSYIVPQDRSAEARQEELVEKYRFRCSCPACETESEIKSEEKPKTEVKPETKPEAEAEPESEVLVEVEAEPESEVLIEVEAEPESEVQVEAEAEPEPEVQVEAEAEPEPEVQVEAEAEPESEVLIEAEPESGVLIEVEAEPESEVLIEVEAEPESEVQAETKAESEVLVEVEAEPESEVQAETEAESEVQAETEPESESEVQVKAPSKGKAKKGGRRR